MKIAIMADSHDRLSTIPNVINILQEKGIKTILHAGDVVFPAFFFEFFKQNIKIHCVKGNNDGEVEFLTKLLEMNDSSFSEFMEMTLEKVRIFMKHKEDYIDSLAKSGDFDLIIYGHTHKVDIRKVNNTLIINPGALSGYLTEGRSFVIIDLPKLTYEVIEF